MDLVIQGKCISKDNSKIQNRQGRYFLSKKYKDYEANVANQVTKQLPIGFKLYERGVSVEAIFCFTNKVHSDLTNCTKSVFDSLNGLVWKDDKQIKECGLSIVYVKDNPRILLDITEIK